MATYKPLFMYVAPASIPQIVAHIQKYLEENPIVSDPEAIAEVIQKYIEEHPEIIAVASVNGKTGNVVLNGNDININATSEVTIATQIANLAAMIAETGGDIDTITGNIEAIYTELDGTEGIKARLTAVETDINDSTNGIKVRLSGIEGEVNGAGGIDSRLTTVENDINAAQTGIKARLTDVETDVSSLKTRMTQAETDIDNNESAIGTINENISQVSTQLNTISTTISDLIRIEEVGFSGTIPANATFAQILSTVQSIDGYTPAGVVGIVFTGSVSVVSYNRAWYKKSSNEIDIVAVAVPSTASNRPITGFVAVMYVKNGCCINNTTTH